MSEPADLPLSGADRELVGAALELLRERADPGRHEVAAALRTKAGEVHRGLHVESSVGRASICAEGVAIGAAAAAGDTEIETIVAVLDTGDGDWRVVTPCGLCRELISDYAPEATVIDYDANREEPVRPVPVMDLLPGEDDAALARRAVIETVLGPIDADRLGPTSMHEHLLSDASALGIPDPADGPVADVVLDDPSSAAVELSRAAAAWRSSSPDALAAKSGDEDRPSAADEPTPLVVDPTVWGFGGPDPRLAEISRATGVAIVAGVGAYVPRTRPEWINQMDEDELHSFFLTALTQGLPECDFKAGIVGMLSPGFPLDEADRRLLRAGARVAVETGSAAIVRLDPRRRDGLEVLEVTAATGLAPERVVFSNVDGYARDLGALRELAAAGATLKWCFGYEAPPRPSLATATDAERADAVATLLAEGRDRQVLACGVWTKAALHKYGGWGYDHLATTVVPMLRARGLTSVELHDLLVTEPRRLLDRA